MARTFPNSNFHGFEVSKEALSIAAHNIAGSKLRNVFLHDANEAENSLGDHENAFDVVTTFDVLHDAPNPAALIDQVRRALKSSGVWLLADIPAAPTMRDNIANPSGGLYFAFSACLCMSCSLSTKDGAGLGTLGFSVPVAEKMLTAGGFTNIDVILENTNARWFVVS
ncbi:sterol 24-C-methyltransferase [Fragilaria crotonensis]|nr:sterol 24-C-methyltransferase [Fragilaria crotonensis]